MQTVGAPRPDRDSQGFSFAAPRDPKTSLLDLQAESGFPEQRIRMIEMNEA